ncbi:UTP--glucose-1-phosphate uridylyltransferase [Fimbriiglobus ruber]|uniref:N-acetylglucosamine-1-phosphate uridyltransferase eukaryotic n=1 Tax=Fimbriiglobus ruber TaxID=1908690 RepID=A0A225E878_9BACT|nr:UDPGP type 1 family protein [Fimbriiglobus ruber]OWK46978.1 N-acetylglucosamine-1-phosphate uridyltransferase eukaryotic [Fimbriiglobus ruber]
MTDAPDDLIRRLRHHGQEHVLTGWDGLSASERAALVAELAAIDVAELEALYRKRDEPLSVLPPRDRIAPLPVESGDELAAAVETGRDALRRGAVAVLLVAGGQGSRLGTKAPKGTFPVGPVTDATLFEIHAEKVLALSRKYRMPVPFLVMTSPATHADTEAFFREHQFFGLARDQVTFFQQGTMPALDLATGKLLLEKPGSLFLSPNGHGGTLTALADTGLLADIKSRGVKHVFYFQVDNPLVAIADPAFVGRHIQTGSEASSKVVFKEQPGEKVGVLALIDGRCGIIEYSDLPAEMAAERGADGNLAFRAGSPAIHVFSVPFLERVTAGAGRLAYHVAKKKVPYFDPATKQVISPEKENALKFEMFIFDALPAADKWLAVSTRRDDEFAPLKNATGPDSPETVRRAISDRAARWLVHAGATVPKDANLPLEISPLYALDADECAAKLPRDFRVTGPLVLKE